MRTNARKVRLALTSLMLLGLVLALVMPFVLATPASAQPNEVWVDDDWAGLNPGDPADGHTFGTDAFATIQDGIDAVAAGGTVHVAAGTYTEQLMINKSLTLIGAGAATTTIQAPVPLEGVTAADKNIITIKGAGVNIEFTGFTVRGPSNDIFSGVLVRDGANANIHDNEIKDTRDDPLSGAQRGWGIVVGGDGRYGILSSTGTATIQNNVITGFQKGGIIVAGASSATIGGSGNTITGTPTDAIAQDCIHIGNDAYDEAGNPIGNGAFATIVGNQVSGCHYLGADNCGWGGAAIFLSGAADSTLIKGNTITGNTWGVFADYSSGNLVTIENNIIANNPGVGIQIWSGWNVRIIGNDITNTGLNDNPNNCWPTTSGGLGIQTTWWPGGNEAHFNNIAGSARKGVENWGDSFDWGASPVPGPFDAENNWWGADSGPEDLTGINEVPPCNPDFADDLNADGAGDKVDDNVDYCPWLGEQYAPTKSTGTATGTGTADFTPDAGALEGLTAVDEATLPPEGKPNLAFPHGFFSFKITGLTPGQTVVVTIELPSDMPVGTQYWKYHVPEGWIQIPIGDDDGDNVVTITLVDGGLGDDDGVADGVITDQGGPGHPPPIPVGGYIVPVSKVELLAPWVGLAALMAMAMAVVIRRRRG